MSYQRNILLGSQADSTKLVCFEVADNMSANMKTTESFEDFLLALQENNYMAAVIDLEMGNVESLKMIRLIRRMRPKIPLIALVKNLNKESGGLLYTEGVNRVLHSPPSKEMIQTALKAISTTEAKHKFY